MYASYEAQRGVPRRAEKSACRISSAAGHIGAPRRPPLLPSSKLQSDPSLHTSVQRVAIATDVTLSIAGAQLPRGKWPIARGK